MRNIRGIDAWEFELGRGDAAASPLVRRCHHDDRAALSEAFASCAAGDSDELEVDCRLQIDDGTYRWSLVRGTVTQRVGGGAARIAGATIDLDERVAREDSLRRAKDRAEAENHAKDDLLAHVSHELRTPMNAILGFAELLLEDEPTPPQVRALQTIKSAGASLLAIVDNLLDYAKVEVGKLALEARPWSPRATLADTLRALAPRAQAKRLELIGNVEPEVPESLVGDALRVRQILTNLVGNAIKFTRSGDVEVNVSCATGSDGEVELRFAVADTGIGIPRDKQATIFEPFQQASSSTTREYGGTGLGLTIAASLASLMRGGIAVDSELGHGSTFTFTGRFAQVAPVARPHRSLAGAPVLVVDDSPAVRRHVSRWLERWGAAPTAAGGLGEARRLLDEATGAGRPFQLVLIDGQLGELASLPTEAPVETMQKPLEEEPLRESVARALDRRATDAGSRRGQPLLAWRPAAVAAGGVR